MRLARGVLLFAGALLATIEGARPEAWKSSRHDASDHPGLLTEAAVGALRRMRRPTFEEPMRPEERLAAERFYTLHKRLVALGPGAVDPMTMLKGHPDFSVNNWVNSVLEGLGPEAIPKLRERVRSLDPNTSQHAIRVLTRHPWDPETVRAVLGKLSHPNDQVRYVAEQFLRHKAESNPYMQTWVSSTSSPRNTGPRPETSDAIASLLTEAAADAPPEVWDELAAAIERCRPGGGSPLLFALARRPEPEHWYSAVSGLREFDPDRDGFELPAKELDDLLARRADADPENRAEIMSLLSLVRGEIATAAIVQALTDPDSDVRWQAVWALASRPRTDVALLHPMLADPDETVVGAALEAVDRIGTRDSYDAVRAVAFPKKEAWVLRVLAKLDPERVQPELLRVAADRRANPEARLAAARHLKDSAALRRLAEDPEAPLRLAALKRLLELKSPDLAPVVATLLQDPFRDGPGDFPLRRAAAYAAGRARLAELTPVLTAMIESAGPASELSSFHRAAFTALGLIGDPAALPSLRALEAWTAPHPDTVLARARLGDTGAAAGLELLLQTAWTTREAIVVSTAGGPGSGSTQITESWDLYATTNDLLGQPTLREVAGRLAELGGTDRLLDLLKLPIEQVHPYVLLGLAKTKDPRAWEPLAAGVQQTRHVQLRRAAAEGFGTFGDPRAMPLLTAALGDPSDWVVAAAAIALEKLTGEDLGMPESVPEAFDDRRRPRFDPAPLRARCVSGQAQP